ncbi:hypothetical protein [Bacillus sp. NPDC077027]|uniref:hypothetical protein n=1 Tax=Bacillus sp. NPDC077027 TaxID=3390548 RepID=UPI003CFE5AA8
MCRKWHNIVLIHLDWRFASSFVMCEGGGKRKENVTRDDKGGNLMMSEYVSKESIMQLLEEIEHKIEAVEQQLALSVEKTTSNLISEEQKMVDRLESDVKECQTRAFADEYRHTLRARPAYHTG